MPSMIQPMLPTLIDHPFTDSDWLFETKRDGVRAICFIKKGRHASFRVANSEKKAGRVVADAEHHQRG